MENYSNIYPTRCNVTQFILSGNCCTCFGWYHHPSSGAHTTVSTVFVYVHIYIFSDRASSYNSLKWPTWRTISSIICLFESSTCFEQLCAHHQEDNCITTTSGIITLKTIEWSKITKIARTHRNNEVTMCSSCFSNFRPLNCFQSNYTRSCINTIVLLKMSTELLETCRGF